MMEFLRPRFYRGICHGICTDEERHCDMCCDLLFLVISFIFLAAGVMMLKLYENAMKLTIALILSVLGSITSLGLMYKLWNTCAILMQKTRHEGIEAPPIFYRSLPEEISSMYTADEIASTDLDVKENLATSTSRKSISERGVGTQEQSGPCNSSISTKGSTEVASTDLDVNESLTTTTSKESVLEERADTQEIPVPANLYCPCNISTKTIYVSV